MGKGRLTNYRKNAERVQEGLSSAPERNRFVSGPKERSDKAREKDFILPPARVRAPYMGADKAGRGKNLPLRPTEDIEDLFTNVLVQYAPAGTTPADVCLWAKIAFSARWHGHQIVNTPNRNGLYLPCETPVFVKAFRERYVPPPRGVWDAAKREAYQNAVREFTLTKTGNIIKGKFWGGNSTIRRFGEKYDEVYNSTGSFFPNPNKDKPQKIFQVKSKLNGVNGEATNKDDVEAVPISCYQCTHPWCVGVVMERFRSTFLIPMRFSYVIPHLGNQLLIGGFAPMSTTHVVIELDPECDGEVCDDCFCLRCIKRSLHTLHTVASEINGANGEFTGTDDLDRQNAARRLNQQARNHRHQKPVPNGRADPDDMTVRVPGVPRPPPSPNLVSAPAIVVPPSPPAIISYYIESMGSVYVDGVLRPPGDLLVVEGDVLVPNVVSVSDGVLRTQFGKGAPAVSAPILAEVDIPAYTTYTESFPSASYLVFYPLLRLLQKQLAGKQSLNTPYACSSLAQKMFPRIPVTETSETIKYFLHLNEYTNSQVLRGNNLIRRMLGAPVDPVVLMANQVMELQHVRGELPIAPREFVRAPAAQCEAPFDFLLRTDFLVQSSKGTSWDGLERETPTVVDNGYFHFNTPEARARWYRTQFFTFNGLDQPPFVHYDNTGHNAACGLKRLVGARADQQALQAAQQNLIPVLLDVLAEGCSCQLPDTIGNLKAMLKVLSTSPDGVTSRYNRVLAPTAQLADPIAAVLVLPVACQAYGVPLFDCAQREVARLHSKMIQSTCRSTMQRILDHTLDTGAIVKDYIYDTPFKALNEYFSPDQQRHMNAEIPHNRREMRRQYVRGVLTHLDEDIMVRRLDACVKNETAKYGKASRLYVAYGAGAMYANDLPDYLKKCISGWYDLGTINGLTGSVCLVATSKRSELSALFAKTFAALSLPNSYLAIAWSDDMDELANLGGQIYGANSDVESNDSSNGAYPFAVYGTCVANFNVLRAGGILRQCMEPVSLRNPSNNDEHVKICFVGPIQGSGTTATSGLNNINSAGTCVATFVYLAHSPWDRQGFQHAIAAGAAACGHTKSVEWCERDGVFSTPRVQFLKHSPLMCYRGAESRTIMVQNLGCILRNFGKVDGDLTAAMVGVTPLQFSTGMSDDERADRFFSAVIEGHKNSPTCPILKALRSRFCYKSATELPKKFRSIEDDDDLSDWTVATEELLERYGMEESELAELVDLISRTRVGYAYTCRALSKIYSVDYGVPL